MLENFLQQKHFRQLETNTSKYFLFAIYWFGGCVCCYKCGDRSTVYFHARKHLAVA